MSAELSPTRTAGGPNPGVVGLISLGLFVGSLVAMAMLSGGTIFTSPFGDTEIVAGFFVDHAFAARFAAMLQVASSISLGIYSAVLYTRLSRLRLPIPGPLIGLFGGIAAALLLAMSAIILWAQSQPAVSANPEVTHALAYLNFAAGGFAHVLGLGVLVAGVALPSLQLRVLPVWFAWVGLLIAFLAELSFLAMVIEPLQFLIPIGRFGSLLWTVIAGFLLPATRRPDAAPE